MSALLFFIVLAILVLSHEFGHFLMAKLSGIRVDEFGFGFPPRLFSFKKGETTYSFNLIPFGGFVNILGENFTEEFVALPDSEKKRALSSKPRSIQALVMVGGVLFNFLLAWFLLSVGLMSGIPVSAGSFSKDDLGEAKLTILQVLPGKPADLAGIKVGDEITFIAMGDKLLQGEYLQAKNVQELISGSAGEEIFFGLKSKEGDPKPIPLTAEKGIIGDKYAIGISMDNVATAQLPFYKAIYEGAILTADMIYEMAVGLSNFVRGIFLGTSSMANISGPVGIAGIVFGAYEMGFVHLLSMIALISINLGVLNLVPFPALDGGRLFFLLIEAIMRRPMKPALANGMNIVGFVLLLFMMAVVTYGDIFKIYFGR